MGGESIYNAKYTVTLEDGTVSRRQVGFYALGREGFMNEVKFMHRPFGVEFKKIWTEEPIDTSKLSYVEY